MNNTANDTDTTPASDAAGAMPHTEGHRAYREGKPKSANPYPEAGDFVDEVEWELGWEDAKAGIPEGM